MTAPVEHGYPDWGRQSGRQDVIYINDTDTIAALKFYDPVFVGATPCIGIRFESIIRAATVYLTWMLDEAGTVTMHVEAFEIRNTGFLALQIVSGGPWLRVSVDPGAAVDLQYELKVWSAAQPRVLIATNGGQPKLLEAVATAVGAGATVTIQSLYTVPGLAHFQVLATPATWDGGITCDDITGTVHRIVTLNQTIGIQPQLVYLLGMPATFSIHNSTGVAGTFWFSLISHSIGQS